MPYSQRLTVSLMSVFFAITFVVAPMSAYAGNQEDLISFGAGVWDVGDDDEAADFRLEYRFGEKLFWELKPWLGAEATSDGSVWGGFGFLIDWMPTDHLYINPSTSVGLYGQGSSDLDLGSVIEFRSQIEAGYQFDAGQRVGVAFGHLSNASIDDENPGTEVLNLYYHVPVGQIFGKSSN